jgi:hypothetical protein
MAAAFAAYYARVPEAQRRMHAPVSELWDAHEAGDDQWFWLHAGEAEAPTAEQALGLLMFTWTPQTPFAKIWHISGVAGEELLEGLVAAARRYILTHCEVRGMRATLWMGGGGEVRHRQGGGGRL